MPPLFNIENISADTVILTNGEKSTFALHSAGIKNAVNTFGEGNRVQEAIELLIEHGVTTVINYPDCDDHGYRAAWKWHTLGNAAGLTVITYDLRAYMEAVYGMEVEAGFDLRDLWLYVNQDKRAFHQALQNMPVFKFDQHEALLPDRVSKQVNTQKTASAP